MADAAVYICRNCFPGSMSLPTQWTHAGMHIRVKLIPCSGKIDAQYILHAFEGGVSRVGIITCPEGKCTLSQGNYRAQVRISTVRQLLDEIGIDPECLQLIRCAGNENAGNIRDIVNDAVVRHAEPLGAVK